MLQVMKINQYEVWVNLGCSKEEQSFVQPVQFNISLHFHKHLKGCVTDQIADAVDYVALTDRIKTIAEQKPYQLVEHMCFLVHQDLVLWLSKWFKDSGYTGELVTELRKLRPPVKSIQGGVEFTCRSELSS